MSFWTWQGSLAQDSLASKPHRIAGYMPEYRAEEIDPAWFEYLTDLILFSAEVAPDGALDLKRLKEIPFAKLQQWTARRKTRLILCVGGWERSANFPSVCSDPQKRKVFVQSAIQICLDKKLSGIDLDWEHPQNAQEETGYTKLLQELHSAFEPHGFKLSIAMAAWQSLPREAFVAVDWIQLMAYDHDGRHSTFDAAVSDINKVLALDAPKSKIVFGIPLYGRQITNRHQAQTYRDIVANFHPNRDLDEINGMYFNGPETAMKKTEYAIENGLGGVMFWEVAQDAPGKKSIMKESAARFQRHHP